MVRTSPAATARERVSATVAPLTSTVETAGAVPAPVKPRVKAEAAGSEEPSSASSKLSSSRSPSTAALRKTGTTASTRCPDWSAFAPCASSAGLPVSSLIVPPFSVSPFAPMLTPSRSASPSTTVYAKVRVTVPSPPV